MTTAILSKFKHSIKADRTVARKEQVLSCEVQFFLPNERNGFVGETVTLVQDAGTVKITVDNQAENFENVFETQSKEFLQGFLAGYRGRELHIVSAHVNHYFLMNREDGFVLVDKVRLDTLRGGFNWAASLHWENENYPKSVQRYVVNKISEVPAVAELVSFFDEVRGGLGFPSMEYPK